jgi:hypothetical protein
LSASSPIDSDALSGLRRRGQFLFSALLWAFAGGFVLFTSAYLLIVYHYVLVIAERLRAGLGWHAPEHGPDWLLLAILATLPGLLLLAAVFAWSRYRRAWNRKLKEVWPDATIRQLHGRWRPLRETATEAERLERAAYLGGMQSRQLEPLEYEGQAEAVLADLEKDIAERAVATGLIVGVSHNRAVDLFTIFAVTLEPQSRLAEREGRRIHGRADRGHPYLRGSRLDCVDERSRDRSRRSTRPARDADEGRVDRMDGRQSIEDRGQNGAGWKGGGDPR